MKQFLCIPLLLLLAACTSTRSGDVTVFHNDPTPQGEEVAITAQEERWQDSLAFKAARDYLEQKLIALGYSAPISAKPPGVIAILNVDQTPVEGGYDNRPRIGIGVGSGSYGRSGGVGIGVGSSFPIGEAGEGPNQYTLGLVLERTDGTRIWEGQVQTRGAYGPMDQITPALIDALLEDFPGPSGVTRKVTLIP